MLDSSFSSFALTAALSDIFNGWNLIGNLLFSGIGFVAFCYGKKLSLFWPMLLGVALTVYPYVVGNTIQMYAIAVALTAALYFTQER